jgi:hypothetical protein
VRRDKPESDVFDLEFGRAANARSGAATSTRHAASAPLRSTCQRRRRHERARAHIAPIALGKRATIVITDRAGLGRSRLGGAALGSALVVVRYRALAAVSRSA